MSPIDDERDSIDEDVLVEDRNADGEDPQSSNGDGTNEQGNLEETDLVEEQIELQFLSPDQRATHHGDLLLAAVVEPEIEDDTEAAEALRANAQIKVGKVSKAARGINAQTVRKFVKVASLRGRGIKRGKPPRVPPGLAAAHHQQTGHLVIDAEDNQIYAVKEEDDESDVGEESDGASSPPPAGRDPTVVSTTTESEKIMASTSNQDTEEEDELSKQSTKHHSLDGTKSSKATKGHKGSDHYPSATHDDHDIPKHVVAETMDVERKLMGELDPHNMLQVQRWRRKKRSGKKKRKSYVKGKVIDGKHELYTLSIAVMLGVRTSIARTNTLIASADSSGRKKILSPQDFMAEEKYEFAPKVRTKINVVGFFMRINIIFFNH